jgi:BirA family biotin operon repressor/biotin-[acetyl-CoA-carboxylase] ligase
MDFASLLQAAPFLEGRLSFLDSTDSTNNVARSLAREKHPDAVVVARLQTAGRGRLSRSFWSPRDTGVYICAVLPAVPSCPMVPTVLAACAASNALSDLCGRQVMLKWVNDLLLDEYKIAGILAERVGEHVIIGIGINLNTRQEEFPSELAHASSLAARCGCLFSPEAAVCAVISSFDRVWAQAHRTDFQEELMEAYRNRLVTLGRSVRVLSAQKERSAVALSVDADGALLVRYDDTGLTQRVTSGDVSVRGLHGYI